MNYKRRKPRRWVRCVMCTQNRAGNSLKGQGGRNHMGGGMKASDRRRSLPDDDADVLLAEDWARIDAYAESLGWPPPDVGGPDPSPDL